MAGRGARPDLLAFFGDGPIGDGASFQSVEGCISIGVELFPVASLYSPTGLALTALGRGQYCLNVRGRPPLAQRENARPTFVVRADQCLIADLVVDATN